MNNFILKLRHIPYRLFVAKKSGLKIKRKRDSRNFNTKVLGWAGYTPKNKTCLIPTLSIKSQLYNTCSFNSATVQKEVDEGVVLSVRGILAWAVKNGMVKGDGFANLDAAQKALKNWGILEQGAVGDAFGESYDWNDYINVNLDTFKDLAAVHKIKTYWEVTSRNDRLKLLDEGKVLDTGIDWYTGFNQGGGFSSPWLIIRPLGWRVGGHAIAIIGYNLNYQGRGVYIVQNSYGSSWGDNGKFYIDMDYFDKNNYGVYANLDIGKNEALLLNNQDMIIKKKDSPALYVSCGQVLIPFGSWESYESDFKNFKIIELSDVEFSKFVVSTNAIITQQI